MCLLLTVKTPLNPFFKQALIDYFWEKEWIKRPKSALFSKQVLKLSAMSSKSKLLYIVTVIFLFLIKPRDHGFRLISSQQIFNFEGSKIRQILWQKCICQKPFLIARLARSDPRNHFSVQRKKKTSSCHLLNFSVFRHVFISSLDMFENRNNSYHIESKQV